MTAACTLHAGRAGKGRIHLGQVELRRRAHLRMARLGDHEGAGRVAVRQHGTITIGIEVDQMSDLILQELILGARSTTLSTPSRFRAGAQRLLLWASRNGTRQFTETLSRFVGGLGHIDWGPQRKVREIRNLTRTSISLGRTVYALQSTTFIDGGGSG